MLHILDTNRAKIYQEYYLNSNRTRALNKNIHPKIKDIICKLEKEKKAGYSTLIRYLFDLDIRITTKFHRTIRKS